MFGTFEAVQCVGVAKDCAKTGKFLVVATLYCDVVAGGKGVGCNCCAHNLDCFGFAVYVHNTSTPDGTATCWVDEVDDHAFHQVADGVEHQCVARL